MRPLEPMPASRLPRLTADRGCYLLIVEIDELCSLGIGRAVETLAPGLYGYAGSAQRGLAARLARHARPPEDKRARWHIDHLLARGRVEAALAYPLQRPGECWLAECLAREPGVGRAARGFGASDCRCPGHLVAFRKPPDLEALQGMALPRELLLRE